MTRTAPTTVLLVTVAACTVALLGTDNILCPDNLSAQPLLRETAVCLDCHDTQLGSLQGGPHHMGSQEATASDSRIACTDCHAGDERHWEEDPAEYPFTNPATAKATATEQMCASCHFASHQQTAPEGNPHSQVGVGCADCHQVHGAPHPGGLKSPEPDLCLDCHVEIRGQMAKPYRHPTSDLVVRCSECHLMLDEKQVSLSYLGTSAACVSCHPEFQGPFPFEHQATLDFSTEEGGCPTCHDPHGSYLPRMLRQPYEAPHFQLCSQCHVVPKHNFNTKHGTAWSGVACNECHVDVHGSYTSRLFFSPALAAQGCFSVGCHQQ